MIEGKKIAEKILLSLKKDIKEKKLQGELAVILIGNDEPSKIYVALKEKAAQKVGIKFRKIELPSLASEEKILKEIGKLNNDESIHGIIVQLPLPHGLNRDKIIKAIKPEKDADGFHPENLAKFFAGEEGIAPVFPLAILEVIKSVEREINPKKAVIICNSNDFGEVMQFMLKKEGIESKYIFRDDIGKNLEEIKKTDILITACGEKCLIGREIIKNGAIVVDGGIVKVGRKVAGDVDTKSVKNKNIFLSPVPGGVGPVTIACLLRNVWAARKKSR